MDSCLRCSGRAVPYSGGGVTPLTLTPNFEFPITAGQLGEKTMTASSPVTLEDLVNGLILHTTNEGENWRVWHNVSENRYELKYDSESMNEVMLSSDGLTVTFGSVGGGPTFASFTFNA